MHARRQFLQALLLAVPACTGRATPPSGAVASDTVTVKAAIQAQMRALEAAVSAGEVGAAVALYTADVNLREPGIDIRGNDSLRAFLTTALKSIEVLELKTVPEHYLFSGDRVVEFAAYRERIRDRATGAEELCDCRYAAEWQRGADGQWRIAYLLAGPRELPAPAAQKPAQ